VIDKIKRIPTKSRAWDPKSKYWSVSVPYIEHAILIVQTTFPELMVNDERPVVRPRRDEDYSVLHLHSTAPSYIVDAVYKAMAKHYHPDVNPKGADKMRKINSAYERIRKRLL
jgi:DnaJ-class molecular chaperone